VPQLGQVPVHNSLRDGFLHSGFGFFGPSNKVDTVKLRYLIFNDLQSYLSNISQLFNLHRFELGENVADENVCLDPQRDALGVIR
jgi:hypothetical protein